MVLGKTRFGGFFFACRKGFGSCYKRGLQGWNGQWLTPERWYVLCLRFTDVFILDPSTESQEALRIKDDRPLAKMAADRMSKWS
ncbi:hypothetical protein ACIQU2_20345 [Pseudomonas sp. NPDC098740]|uniref:hypothetical protein n=1 Tax=Pseudomonas sp. NPDC098740 TaxID=3364486 RepID=UPI00383A665B